MMYIIQCILYVHMHVCKAMICTLHICTQYISETPLSHPFDIFLVGETNKTPSQIQSLLLLEGHPIREFEIDTLDPFRCV